MEFHATQAYSPHSCFLLKTEVIILLASSRWRSVESVGFEEQYRSGCDLMNLFFVIDEHTDVLDEASVQALADISMDALLNPTKPRPDGESVIGEMTRQ